jgi:hypothetical protein
MAYSRNAGGRRGGGGILCMCDTVMPINDADCLIPVSPL